MQIHERFAERKKHPKKQVQGISAAAATTAAKTIVQKPRMINAAPTTVPISSRRL